MRRLMAFIFVFVPILLGAQQIVVTDTYAAGYMLGTSDVHLAVWMYPGTPDQEPVWIEDLAVDEGGSGIPAPGHSRDGRDFDSGQGRIPILQRRGRFGFARGGVAVCVLGRQARENVGPVSRCREERGYRALLLS